MEEDLDETLDGILGLVSDVEKSRKGCFGTYETEMWVACNEHINDGDRICVLCKRYTLK